MIREAMLFCAGFGTRMQPLTDLRPKPLIGVGGQSLLCRALGMLHEAGVRRVVINLHYLGEMIEGHLARHAPSGLEIIFSHEPDILETGGGLQAARELFSEPAVVTLNPDTVFAGPNPLPGLMRAWDPARMDALLLLTGQAQAVAHQGCGDFRLDPQARLIRRGDAPDAPYFYPGAGIIALDAVANHPAGAFSLNKIWDQCIRKGRAYGHIAQIKWADVGHPAAIGEAELLLEQG